MLFHHDSAPSHSSALAVSILVQLHYEFLPHTPYSLKKILRPRTLPWAYSEFCLGEQLVLIKKFHIFVCYHTVNLQTMQRTSIVLRCKENIENIAFTLNSNCVTFSANPFYFVN